MAENLEEEINSDDELLKKINNSLCAIKYPENILSCLKSLNLFNHLKICPHYCPVGKIIKICSSTSGISSVWVAITSRVLPVTGEALYILRKSSIILKNDFPLVGFMGKTFSNLDITMFKIDDLCIHKTSQQLKIGVKIYFKHWEKCSVPILEIPQNGIQISPNQENEKNSPSGFYLPCQEETKFSQISSDVETSSESISAEFGSCCDTNYYENCVSNKEETNFSKCRENAYENLGFQMEMSDCREIEKKREITLKFPEIILQNSKVEIPDYWFSNNRTRSCRSSFSQFEVSFRQNSSIYAVPTESQEMGSDIFTKICIILFNYYHMFFIGTICFFIYLFIWILINYK